MSQSTISNTGGWGRTRSAMAGDGSAADVLLRVVDAGLCGVICVAPYFFGGRHDFGRLVLVSLIAVTAIAWFFRQTLLPRALWTKSAAHGLLLAAAGLLVLQLVPLPATWLAALSARTPELLPLWKADEGGAAHLGAWTTLSLTPHETAKSLAMFASYGLLFLVVKERVRDAVDVRRLLRMIAVSSVLMAIIGVLQYYTSDGRFLWFYDHPYRTTSANLCGSFINRNHFASFLTLGVVPLLAWLLESTALSGDAGSRRTPPPGPFEHLTTWFVAAALVFVVCIALRTLSRGGAMALLTAATVFVAIGWSRRLLDSRYVYGLAALAVVVVGLLSLDGYELVVQRLDDFAQGSLDAMDQEGGRRRIWSANAAAIEAGWLAGSGAGSHSEICRVYQRDYATVEYTHAESGYLQVATESGIFGEALLLAGIGLCGWWCWTGVRRTAARSELLYVAACAAGLAASAVHSAVDFVWYIPACMSVTVVLAGCALRLSQFARSTDTEPTARVVLPRARWMELAAGAVLIAGWSVYSLVGPGIAAIYWDRYLRASVASREQAQRQMLSLVASRQDSASAVTEPLADAMVAQLERALAWDPAFARAQLRLASAYIAQFELLQQRGQNAMSLPQIEDAALASRFASADEVRAWLFRAFGESAARLYRAECAARRAIRLCPLQGEAYLLLGELSFLAGGRDSRDAYFEQALVVRPHDAELLYEIGGQKFLSGAWEEALSLWRECFAARGPHQWKIIYLQAARIPAAIFVANYRPNWNTLREIWARYRAFGQRHELEYLVKYAAEAAERETAGAPTARQVAIWYALAGMHSELGRDSDALACLKQAHARDQRNFDVRLALANALLKVGRYAEAEPHVRWCLARRPEQKNLSAALLTISKQQLAAREATESSVRRANFTQTE